MISIEQLQQIVQWAEERLTMIKQKYPELRPYLVFSSSEGQVAIESGPVQILKEFPSMVLDGEEKRAALAFVANMSQRSDIKSQDDTTVDACLGQVQFNDDTHIELRFGVLKYQQIWALQNDDLIDKDLTMQSRASIRVVLSNLKRAYSEIGLRRNQPTTV